MKGCKKKLFCLPWDKHIGVNNKAADIIIGSRLTKLGCFPYSRECIEDLPVNKVHSHWPGDQQVYFL